MQLSNEEIRRYSRHLILPEVGLGGQKKICSTSVLCIGAGGLGSPIAMYLAAAGIGKLGILDFDAVDFSNLQRQIIHGTEDVGRPKTQSAKETLNAINPNVEVVAHNTRITSDNALQLIQPYDIIVDGTDNFPTRYLTNDACVLLQRPHVYGSIFRFEGQASVFAPHLGGPCYRCLYPEPPPPGMVPSCAEGGVLGVLPGIIGCIQATEILKLALGKGSSLVGRLLLFNALDMKFREVKLRRDPQCPICGENPTIKELIDYEMFCGIQPEPAQVSDNPDEVSVQEMKRALDDANLHIRVVDVRDQDEWDIARVKGTSFIPLNALAQSPHYAPTPPPTIYNNEKPKLAGEPSTPIAQAVTQYSIGDPTDEEQMHLELINRARLDANAEALRLIALAAIDPNVALGFKNASWTVDTNLMKSQFSIYAPAPPLSMNDRMTTSARGHSQWMLDNAIQDHTGLTNSTPLTRVEAAGYQFSALGENVYLNAESVQDGQAAFDVDWGFGPGGMQTPPGHRNTIHNANFFEVGIGVIKGSTTNQSTGNVGGPQSVTEDFAAP